MESNANKEEFLSSDYIKIECIKKYTAPTTENLNSEQCSASVFIHNRNAGVEFIGCGCQNDSDRIITSVTTVVSLENIAGKTGNSLRFRNTRDNLFILPKACFAFMSMSAIDEKDWDVTPNGIPDCSDLDTGEVKVCKSWGILAFESLKTNIE